MLLESGQLDNAMQDLKWAIGLEEQNWLYNYEYGRALERQGNKDLATRQYETALKQVKEIGDPLTAGQVEAALRAVRSKKG